MAAVTGRAAPGRETGVAATAIAVGIETPRGVVVGALIDLGCAVFAMNPKQLDRFLTALGRPAKTTAAMRAGRRCTAHRPRAFRRVRAEDPLVIELRELTRMLDDLATRRGD